MTKYEELKAMSGKCCLSIYMHYHVSQTKDLPEPIKKAWSVGQELWVETTDNQGLIRG